MGGRRSECGTGKGVSEGRGVTVATTGLYRVHGGAKKISVVHEEWRERSGRTNETSEGNSNFSTQVNKSPLIASNRVGEK